MRKTVILALLLARFAFDALAQQPAPSNPSTPSDVERYTTALSASRRKLFAEAMNGLTAPQLETFWSVFGDYEKEKNELALERVKLVNTFAESFGTASGLSDADVTRAVNEMATLQKKLTDLRVKYFDIYSKRIDVKTAGRFALTDDFVSTAVRLDWLNKIPFPGD